MIVFCIILAVFLPIGMFIFPSYVQWMSDYPMFSVTQSKAKSLRKAEAKGHH